MTYRTPFLITFFTFLIAAPAQKPSAKEKNKPASMAKSTEETTATPSPEENESQARYFHGQKVTIGMSVQKRKIILYRYGYTDRNIIFLIAGMHGNEMLAVRFMKRLKRDLDRNKDLVPDQLQLWVLPVHNVDGYRVRGRLNARKVDINRNFGTKNWQRATRVNRKRFPMGGGKKPFSEPESRALKWIFDKYKSKISLVINVHCCGRVVTAQKKSPFAMKLEEEFLKHVKYRTLNKSWNEVAYKVTGSFSQWHWEKFKIPDVFIELDKHQKRPYRELKKSIFAILNYPGLKKK